MTGRSPMVDERGRGERAENARSRKFWWILGGAGLLGGVLGGVHSVLTMGDFSQGLPAGWAIALAVAFSIGSAVVSIYFFRSIDELELRDNLVACTIGLYFYILVYPAWFLLWKGGLVVEPMHEALFFGTLIAMMAAYFWKKLRP